MQRSCYLTITTEADGTENKISRKGEWEIDVTTVRLHYREDGADVYLEIKEGRVFIQRIGDYTLTLVIEEGKMLEGRIGIGGNEGVVETYTYKVSYSIGKDSLLLSMRYDLIIGGESQEMKIRLYAKDLKNMTKEEGKQ